MLCPHYGVGSAVVGYFIYVLIVIGLNYISFYKKLINLNRWKIFDRFIVPTLISFAILAIVSLIPIKTEWFSVFNERLQHICVCIIKSALWLIPYLIILHGLHIINLKSLVESNKASTHR